MIYDSKFHSVQRSNDFKFDSDWNGRGDVHTRFEAVTDLKQFIERGLLWTLDELINQIVVLEYNWAV